MAKVSVKVRSDIGDPGHHIKYGRLEPGAAVIIEEEDFAAGLFERPGAGWLSPHEQKDRERAAELKQKVGDQEPPKEKKAPAPQPAADGKEA